MNNSYFKMAAVAGACLLALGSRGQDQATNPCIAPPPTELETFESQTGRVIIKGSAPIGTMTVDDMTVSIVCKEDTDAGAGRKEYGLEIDLGQANRVEDRTVVDYDELASILSALDYLAKVDWSVTTLASFDASYTTKGGFKVAAFSSRRSGSIEYRMRSARMPKGKAISPSQLVQFRSLIDEAKRKLDSIRSDP